MRPTELGESLARIGARIHALNREASKLVQSYRKGHTGRIRIAGTPIFMDGVVSTLIADFHNRHPEVQIAQSYGYFDTLAGSLRNGSLDMAILPLHQGSVPADMGFVPLLPGRNVVACRAVHPAGGPGRDHARRPRALSLDRAARRQPALPRPAAGAEVDRQGGFPRQFLRRHLRLDRQRARPLGLR